MTDLNQTNLTKTEAKMVERLQKAPKQRVITETKTSLKTLDSLVEKGVAQPLYLPTEKDPKGMYALKNERNTY